METVIERLKKLFNTVVDENADFDGVDENSRLTEDLGLTSISMLYMVLAIEEEFDVCLTNLSVNDFKTVGDIVAFLSK